MFCFGLLVAALIGSGSAHAQGKVFRWSSQGDIITCDPHGQVDSFSLGFLRNVFDHLVTRDREQRIVPALATSWELVSPTVWRFKLRQGVRFHDGGAFTADDVVFSIRRSQAKTSTWRSYALAIGEPVKIDDYTVEFRTTAPNPTVLDQLNYLLIVNEAWMKKYKAELPADPTKSEDVYASLHANGTGAFRLVSWQPEVKAVLKKNDDWWGISEKRFEGNVRDVEYLPMQSAATRVAALTSGGVDFVLDIPIQDIPRVKASKVLKVVQGVEGRFIFLGMDQASDTLKYSDVKGSNPFKSLKVRQALYQAIDIESLKTQVMRGYADPNGVLLTPVMTGYRRELDARLPYDPVKSRALLKEAGYPDGFAITLDCPNNRYVNDERICVALASMFGKVGIRAKVNAMPKAAYFQKLERGDSSFYLLGQGTESSEALQIMAGIMHSADGRGYGSNNYGRINDPALDRAIEQVSAEMDPVRRGQRVAEAMVIAQERVYYLPLHRQVVPWAMRGNVHAFHNPANMLELMRVKVE